MPVVGERRFDGAGLLVITVVVSTSAALLSLLVMPRPRPESLVTFYRRVRPAGAWGPVRAHCPELQRTRELGPVLGGWVGGLLSIFGLLFGLGRYLLGSPGYALVALTLASIGTHMVRSALDALPSYEEAGPRPPTAAPASALSLEVLQAPDVPRFGFGGGAAGVQKRGVGRCSTTTSTREQGAQAMRWHLQDRASRGCPGWGGGSQTRAPP